MSASLLLPGPATDYLSPMTDEKDRQVESTEPVNDENDTEGHSLQMLEYGRTLSQDRSSEMERKARESRMREEPKPKRGRSFFRR